MSGVFKAIGKVFKKVVKVVKKVAVPALMIGAVVLTGGAALGVLPSVGSVIGGLGLSTGVTAVLTGAVTSGAIGAGLGALSAAVTGGSIMKGATTGFVGGAATGGLLGAVSPSSVAGLDRMIGGKGAGLLGNAGTSAAQAGANTLSSQVVANGAPSVAAAGGAAPITGAGAGLLPTAATTGGSFLGNNAGSLLQFAGSAIGGLGQGLGAKAASKEAAQQRQTDYDRIAYNYGFQNQYARDRKGKVINGQLPTGQTQWYQYGTHTVNPPRPTTTIDGTQGLVGAAGASPYYQIVNGKVVLVQPQA